MKFFRKKKILFKLILTLCICLLLCPFATNNMYVYADDKKKVEAGHYKVHLYEEVDKNNITSQTGPATIYTFSDECQKTVMLSNGVKTITWKYHDGSTEEEKETVKGETNTGSTVENTENLEWSPALTAGKLLTPIFDFLMTIGDSIMAILQKSIMGTSSAITFDLSTSLLKIIAGILAAVVAVAAVVVVTGGLGLLAAGIGEALGSALTAIGSSGIVSVLLIGAQVAAGLEGYKLATKAFDSAFLPDITVIPTYSISPEEIFVGKLLIFDINFFHPKTLKVHLSSGDSKDATEYEAEKDGKAEYYYYLDGSDEIKTSKQNTALQLSSVISGWYYSIRNFALIVMMLVLIYVGIRMMLSSVASEKSKYKKMLGDWVISMCLVFLLHYIMVFLVSINEDIVKLVNNATEKNSYEIVLADLKNKSKFVDRIKDSDNDELKQALVDAGNNSVLDDNGEVTGEADKFVWPTNLVGQVRMEAQMQDGTVEYIGYSIAFLALVFYTLFFAVTYLKRVIYMAFLTVIAPLVAMTYSIDKIADGKAQAFNMWLKEYVFNLLIQPVHLLLYMLLINMAFELASENIIYTLVAIGFMMPAEKLIRAMFGLDKAKTPGLLGGATGAALTMSALHSLDRFAGKGPGAKNLPGKGSEGRNDKDPDGIYNIKPASGGGIQALLAKDTPSKDTPSKDNVDETEKGDNKNKQETEKVDTSKIENANIETVENAKPQDELEERKEEKPEENSTDKEVETNKKKDRLLEESKKNINNTGGNKNNLTRRERAKNKIKEIATETNDRIDTFGRIADDGLRREVFSKGAVKRAFKTAVPKTLRGGARLTGAAVGAGVGLAAGITSGDPNTTLKNVGLGITAGNSIGTGIANGMSNFSDSYADAKVEYEKERYGDKYDEHKLIEANKKFVKDDEARRFYSRKFSSELNGLSGKAKKEKLDEIMNDACKYRNEGVTDNEMIANAMQLKDIDNTGNRASGDRIAAAMIATKSKDRKAVKEYKTDYLDKYVNAERSNNITNGAMKLAGFSLK